MTTTTTKASTTSTTSMFRPSLLFLSTNAFDAGNRTKHHRRNNSVVICVVLVVCWFCWNFVLASKRRIRPRQLAVNGKNGPDRKQEKRTHKPPKRWTKRLKDSRDMHSTFGTERGAHFYTTSRQYANPSHFRAMRRSQRHFEIRHTKSYAPRCFYPLLTTANPEGTIPKEQSQPAFVGAFGAK